MHLIVFLFLLIICPIESMALEGYANLVEEIMPSVVNISTKKANVNPDEDIDNIMLNQNLPERETLGSGFFIRDDGYILTNYHVIKGSKTISIITNDEKSYDAHIIGIDIPSDLAVLKIDDKKQKFKAVAFGKVDTARIGDIILTFGNPYGLGISVSQGIISAKSRHIDAKEQPYIQTDASINQGNSGGPMFNLDGEVIGVNTALFTIKGASGVGFALPSDIANWVSSQLIKDGKVHRGWLGFSVSNGMDRYTEKTGFVVTEINESSVAYKEGIRVGDIITAYNDNHANSLDDFSEFTDTLEPGQALRLKILSQGEEFRYVIRLQEMPAEALKEIINKTLIENRKYAHQEKDTFYVSELDIAVKETNPRGLLITKIDKKSPLYNKGVKIGDIILEADSSDIYSIDNLLDIIRNSIAYDSHPVSLLIQGIDNAFYITAKVEEKDD